MKVRLLGILIFLVFTVAAFGQQKTYSPTMPTHGPFTGGVAMTASEFLGPYFELPQPVASATDGYVTWGPGTVYPSANVAGGIRVDGGSAALGASKNACDFPTFATCDIVIASPYRGVAGATGTGTLVAGEQIVQGTSNAVAYILAVPGASGPMYISKVVSGTADSSHTWTGQGSSATFVPTAAPSSAYSAAVLVTTSLAVARLPGVTQLAYVETNSSSVPTKITYPYQLTAAFESLKIPNFTYAGAEMPALHSVSGTCAIGSTCSVTFSNAGAFSAISTYACYGTDTTGAHAVVATNSSGTAVAFTGTGTDTVNYYCIGY